METLIKSRARVQQFGEVFTPRWMVQKMLAAPEIQNALRDPATKFLEPCCGEGAFLTEILRRKLFYRPAFPWHILRSLYGIEIQLDNLVMARKNLAQIFAAHCHIDFEDPRIWQILNKNIFRGDVLKFEIPTLFEEVTDLSKNPLADLLKNKCGLSDDQIKSMVIISNPPYQEDKRGDTSNYDRPIYHKFLEEFHATSDRVMVIHPARCLFDAGATPKDFNDKILADENINVAIYEPDSKKVFPDAEIKGGIAVTYRDANKKFGAIVTFTPFEELNSIFHKVIGRKDFRPLNEIIYTQKLYKFSRKFYEENPDAQSDGRTIKTNAFEMLPNFFVAKKPDDGREYIEIYGRYESKRTFRFCRADFVDDNINLRKYKVFIPKAYGGSGALNENGPAMLVGLPLVGLPLVGCTETFITLGAFDTRAEALAAEKYIKTKFSRALLGVKKVTQEATPDKWEYVPLQDFSAESDIDWSRSVHQIDAQLYRKYKLDAREIHFIESKVKAMA